jgi:dihydroxyacetone kinase-like predicted kinase
VALTSLDGRAFEKFVAAGTYVLRRYRGVLNDLNVLPVQGGDTGSNMYLTARSALAEVVQRRSGVLSSAAEAAAHGSLLGARGNSGVIRSQMLRGFAHNVRHRPQVDTLDLAIAMREAVSLPTKPFSVLVLVPTRDMPSGLAALLALASADGEAPEPEALLEAARAVRSAPLFFAGKDSKLGGIVVRRGSPAALIDGRILTGGSLAEVAVAVARELGAADGGLLTLYYGGMQKEADARALVAALRAAYPGTEVEYYFGGQRANEYVISLER